MLGRVDHEFHTYTFSKKSIWQMMMGFFHVDFSFPIFSKQKNKNKLLDARKKKKNKQKQLVCSSFRWENSHL